MTCRSFFIPLSLFFFLSSLAPRYLPSFPTRRSSDLSDLIRLSTLPAVHVERQARRRGPGRTARGRPAAPREWSAGRPRSEEHTSELQSRGHLVCRLLLEKKKNNTQKQNNHKVTQHNT